jgi:hypothetical protein
MSGSPSSLRSTIFILRFFVGQFGDRALKEKTREMLLGSSDLDGDWTLLGERSWRTGALGWRSEIARRARRAGTFTARCAFNQGPYRGLFIQVFCYATPGDAEAKLSDVFSRLIYTKAKRKLHARAGIEIPEGFSKQWQIKEIVSETKKGLGSQKLIAGSVSSVVFLVAASGYDEGGWEWEDVGSIATAQAAKIEVSSAAS